VHFLFLHKPSSSRNFRTTSLQLNFAYRSRWLGSVTVGCQTYDREVRGLTLGQVAIKWLLLGWVTVDG